MDDGITMPVIAGLSVGIAMIVIFALFFSSHPYLVIEGLKDSYHVGEPITFTLRVEGYGYYCQSPRAAIWNASSVFDSVPVWRSGLPSVMCPPHAQPHIIDDNYTWGRDRNATIGKAGDYVFGAGLENQPAVQKVFRVIP